MRFRAIQCKPPLVSVENPLGINAFVAALGNSELQLIAGEMLVVHLNSPQPEFLRPITPKPCMARQRAMARPLLVKIR